jgi:hypothetical protein
MFFVPSTSCAAFVLAVHVGAVSFDALLIAVIYIGVPNTPSQGDILGDTLNLIVQALDSLAPLHSYGVATASRAGVRRRFRLNMGTPDRALMRAAQRGLIPGRGAPGTHAARHCSMPSRQQADAGSPRNGRRGTG